MSVKLVIFREEGKSIKRNQVSSILDARSSGKLTKLYRSWIYIEKYSRRQKILATVDDKSHLKTISDNYVFLLCRDSSVEREREKKRDTERHRQREIQTDR
jgi:hypothetical protein